MSESDQTNYESEISFDIISAVSNPGFSIEKNLVIIYVLKGSVNLSCFEVLEDLNEEDFFVVNPYNMYKINPRGDFAILLCRIHPSMLSIVSDSIRGNRVYCNSKDSEGTESALNAIRKELAGLFVTQKEARRGYKIELHRKWLDLLAILMGYFLVPVRDELYNNPGEMSIPHRFQSICCSISEHFHESITLESLAHKEYMSPGYLSRLFQKYLGTTFSHYLTILRLNHARQLLRETESTITDIAFASGFNSVNAFIRRFHQIHHVSPGEYRKRNANLFESQPTENTCQVHILNSLLKHLMQNEGIRLITNQDMTPVKHFTVDARDAGKPFHHNWKKLINIGWANYGLTATIQDQLRKIQADIGFSYLHFHGLLDDSMMVYQEDSSGNPIYNFTYIDTLFDFLMSISLKPYIEFGFMPQKLACISETKYTRGFYICMPKSVDRWCELIMAFMEHCIYRYGINEVRSWKFTLFSLLYAQYSSFTQDEYHKLYMRTYRTIKFFGDNLLFGGPSLDISVITSGEMHLFLNFIGFCRENSCIPDFLTTIVFPHDFSKSTDDYRPFMETLHIMPISLSSDKDFLANQLALLRKITDGMGLYDIEICVEEWNATIWQQDLCNDTSYKSAFLVKNILENDENVSLLGYWTLSDQPLSRLPTQDLFHGGFGLITYNGITKCGYNAMQFLNMLGCTIIFQREGCTLTRAEDEIQLIFYNYYHYNRLYRFQYISEKDRENRYSVFSDTHDQHWYITLTGLPPGEYFIEESRVGRKYGSAYDKWLEMGAIQMLRDYQLQYLRMSSQPFYKACTQSLEYNCPIDITVDPHEICIVRMKRIGELKK